MLVDPLRKLSSVAPVSPSGSISAAPDGSPKSPASRPDSHESFAPPKTFFQKIWGGIQSVWNFLCRYTFLGRFFKPYESPPSSIGLNGRNEKKAERVVNDQSPSSASASAENDDAKKGVQNVNHEGPKDTLISVKVTPTGESPLEVVQKKPRDADQFS